MLINTAPLFTALLAVTFLGERLRVLGWVGMAVSFFGAVLISAGEGGGFGLAPQALVILLAALSSSIYFVIQKPYLQKYGALAFTTYAVWAGTLLSLVFLPGLISQMGAARPRTTLAMVYLGVFPHARFTRCQLPLPHPRDGLSDRVGLDRGGTYPTLGSRWLRHALRRPDRQRLRTAAVESRAVRARARSGNGDE